MRVKIGDKNKFKNSIYNILGYKMGDNALNGITIDSRLIKNGYPIESLKGKKALDAGCGGGRYSVALRKLGLSDVTGIDMSESGLKDAKNRVSKAKIDGVKFMKGNVLELPFDDETLPTSTIPVLKP